MSIVSSNLAGQPFDGSCDSTRMQMAAKQITQALTHTNCEIPYVTSTDYRDITNNSPLGICIAKDDGNVIYKNNDIIVIHYTGLNKIEIKEIPLIKKSIGIFSSSLRFCLPSNTPFMKGDIIYEYDCFRTGVPSFGYNAYTAMMPFFGYNHEDGIVISESFANKAKHRYIDRVIIPVFEHSIFQPIYKNDVESFKYFPAIGQQITNNIFAMKIEPKISDYHSMSDIKQKMTIMLKSMNLSDMIGFDHGSSNFSTEPIETKINSGIIQGYRIHKLKDDVRLIDDNLQNVLENMHILYFKKYAMNAFFDLNNTFSDEYCKFIMAKYFVFSNRQDNITTNRNDILNAVYIIECDIYKEENTKVGDKICNRYAGKGVVGHILPDELRPISTITNKPIDVMFNSFGVPSRMNISVMPEALISKNMMICDNYIRTNPDKITDTLKWIKLNIIDNFNDIEYSSDVERLINNMDNDTSIRKTVIDSIFASNLFVEAPPFKHINIEKIKNNSVQLNEPVFQSRKFLQYMRQCLRIELPFPAIDKTVDGIMCAPIYTVKLNKISEKIIASRNVGPYKSITKQPVKGRALKGGVRVGQMEAEAILSSGCPKALHELYTVKSDYTAGKENLLEQLIEKGYYEMPTDITMEVGTKKVVTTLLKALQL
jgi:DNA-directed RNA polymerase beta subunit